MKNQLEKISEAEKAFREVVKKSKLNEQVYEDGWTAKEIIAHVVSWNDYYAHTLKALADGNTPNYITESMAKVSNERVEMYSELSREELLERLENSNRLIIQNAPNVKETRIIYKEGAKDYTLVEYLEIIWKHMNKHTADLRRSLK